MQTSNMTGSSSKDGAISRKVEDASSSVHHAIDRASSAAGPVVDQLASGAHQVADRVAGAATQAAQSIEGASGRLMAAPTQWMNSCGNYVQQKPVTALGIAAASGFLLGLLVRLR